MVATAAAVELQAPALFPRQHRFVFDARRYPAYIGGIGSGKSFAGVAKVVHKSIGDQAAQHPGLVIAPTYPMLRDATQRTLLAFLQDTGIAYRHYKSDKLLVLANGHEIMLRSADDPDSLRGPNCAYAYVDEAALVTKETWQIIKGRVRVGPNPQAWITGTPKGRNWIWAEWERDATGTEFDPDHPLYRVRTDENPTLGADFIADLGYAGAFAAQELGGQFVAFEGLVYPSFRRAQVRPAAVAEWASALALDTGTRNPTALLTARFAGDAIHIERELYRREMDSEQIVAAAISEYHRAGAAFIVVDPSAAGYIQSLRHHGLHVREAKNAVIEGIQRVTAALADLSVDPSCVNLIAEFESYQYPATGDKDQPVKANDHAMDALRYLVMELTKPKRKVRVW